VHDILVFSRAPPGRAGDFLLCGQEKVTKEKATPRTRPPHVHVLRIRSRSPGFADGTSLCLRGELARVPRAILRTRPQAASEGPRLARILRVAASCNGAFIASMAGNPWPALVGRVTTRRSVADGGIRCATPALRARLFAASLWLTLRAALNSRVHVLEHARLGVMQRCVCRFVGGHHPWPAFKRESTLDRMQKIHAARITGCVTINLGIPASYAIQAARVTVEA